MNSNRYIVCGKLDNRLGFGSVSAHASTKLRIQASSGRADYGSTEIPASVGNDVVWAEGRSWDIDAFLARAATAGNRRIVVLTANEYLKIVERADAFGLRVDALESSVSILPKIKYRACPRANYDVLMKHLRKLRQLNIHPKRLSKDLADQHLRAVARKLRFKNGYDRNFFFAYTDGYQEVFKLKEERADRAIVALDFNSMYLDSMRGRFCNPSLVEYKDFRGVRIDPSELLAGVYRVRLCGARPSFLLDHHPFRYKRLCRSYWFQMRPGDSVETILHRSEIDYFAPFFSEFEIVDGLVSLDTIEHPLLAKGLAQYSQRMYHRRRGDDVKERLCKLSIQHMHSSTNQRSYAKKYFGSLGQVRSFLADQFLINLETSDDEELASLLMRHKYFDLKRKARGYQLSYIDAGAPSVVFGLSAQVVANARLKMVKTIERFLRHSSVELCYANIDSLHLSIHRNELDAFFKENEDIISDNVGSLKVEAIADRGYWFDVGRYWLMKDEAVVLFRNKGLNHVAALSPFVARRKISRFLSTPTFSHLNTRVAKIENAFEYQKRVEHRGNAESRFVRFQFCEVADPFVANVTEATERLRSMKDKVELFGAISNSSLKD